MFSHPLLFILSHFHLHILFVVVSLNFQLALLFFYKSVNCSAGNECVLVKWQIQDVNDRRFVPRIAAEIRQIALASNNIFVAVATKDNAIRIFDNTLIQTTLIQHLVLGKHFECGMVFDSRTRALIMNGNQGHIQFYSPEDMSLLYSVSIVVKSNSLWIIAPRRYPCGSTFFFQHFVWNWPLLVILGGYNWSK